MTIQSLDTLDRDIITALQAQPTRTNKDIGDRLGVSEATIATRIRAMEQKNIIRVMMQRDVRALGYDLMALIDINVEGRQPEAVAAELAEIEECVAVTIAMSNPDIVVHVIAHDGRALQELIDNRLALIEGIVSYEIMTSLEVVKLDQRFGGLDAA